MNEDQIDIVLKAIDDSQKELMDKVNKQMEDFATKDKLD